MGTAFLRVPLQMIPGIYHNVAKNRKTNEIQSILFNNEIEKL